MTRTVFLDRDGTLNREVDFLARPEQLEVLPGVREALQRLHDAGWRLVVLTNQSGIARGFFGERELAAVHARLHELLGRLPLAYLHCPHHPDVEGGGGYRRDCLCRKPKAGLLHQARQLLGDAFGVAFEGGAVIGDSARDLLMATGLPLQKVLVASGKPIAEQRAALAEAGCAVDHEASGLREAADWLLER